MRTLIVLFLGIAIGAAGLYYYQQQPSHAPATSELSAKTHDAAERAAEKTRAVAADVSAGLGEKMRDWHLTRDDIRADLARGGEIAREKAAVAKVKIADAAIVATIKAKYVLDRELSANRIGVEANEGSVTLSGTAPSEEAIGKAVALALDTEGVRHVTSKISVKP
jgi:osmotically-inducible protein OsmY